MDDRFLIVIGKLIKKPAMMRETGLIAAQGGCSLPMRALMHEIEAALMVVVAIDV